MSDYELLRRLEDARNAPRNGTCPACGAHNEPTSVVLRCPCGRIYSTKPGAPSSTMDGMQAPPAEEVIS